MADWKRICKRKGVAEMGNDVGDGAMNGREEVPVIVVEEELEPLTKKVRYEASDSDDSENDDDSRRVRHRFKTERTTTTLVQQKGNNAEVSRSTTFTPPRSYGERRPFASRGGIGGGFPPRNSQFEEKKRNTSVKGSAEDVFKSLDDLVKERQIIKPGKYGGSADKPSNPLFESRGARFSSAGARGGTLDPRASSLDAIVVDRGFGGGEGAQKAKEVRMEAVDKETLRREFEESHKSEMSRSQSSDGNSGGNVVGDEPDRGGPLGDPRLLRQQKPVEPVYSELVPLTPFGAAIHLADLGMVIELELGILKDVSTEAAKERLYRCIISSGRVVGIADSVRKSVAREMAAVAFFTELEWRYPGCSLPKYEIPRPLLVHPNIFKRVYELAAVDGHFLTFNTVRMPDEKDEEGKPRTSFVCSVTINKHHEYKGRSSFIKQFARIEAAFTAYKLLYGQEFPLSPKLYGEFACVATDSEKYAFVEKKEIAGIDKDAAISLLTED